MKIFSCFIFLNLLFTASGFAQTDTTKALEEVVVSGNKFEQLKKESPNLIQVISKQEIQQINAPNTANLLEQTGGVFIQRSQAGGGSPVLRGFEASRVLMVIDGVRMNNAIFRSGHLQNILRIDQNMLERTEIVFGPSSVIYGSDALGGVVHFRTKSPTFNSKSVSSYLRHASAYNEKTGHVDFNIGGKNFASLTSISYSSFGDLVMGRFYPINTYQDFGLKKTYVERINGKDQIFNNPDPYVQRQSAYSQYDILQKFNLKTGLLIHSLNFQFSTTSNVPRYDRLTEITNDKPRFAEWYYGPEQRFLASYQLDLNERKLFSKGVIVAGFQNILESRHSRRLDAQFRRSQNEAVKVLSINADFQKIINKNTFQYGLEITDNDVQSTAIQTDVDDILNVKKSDTRYPDGKNKMQTIGFYLADIQRSNKSIVLNTGLRYNRTNLVSNFIEKQFFPFPFNSIEQRHGALSGNIGLVFLGKNNFKFSLLGATGFRSPNVDDLAKVFDSTPTTIIVPNPNIKPEFTYNFETTLSKTFNNKLTFEGTYFSTWFRNVIAVGAFNLNGQSTVRYAGQESKVMASQNLGKAYLSGFNLNLKMVFTKNLVFSSSFNTTKGHLIDNKKTPLDHIPPAYGRTGLKFQTNKFNIDIFTVYNGWKRLQDYSPSGEDNLQYATKDGTPSWATLNVRSGLKLNKNITVQAGIENIFDRNYRNFASGISSAGRNYVVTLRWN